MRVVLCNGCWDGLHVGHIRHFYQARRMGDYLVVSVTDDENVRREKGEGRPMFTIEERMEVLKALAIVDRVIPVKGALDALWTVRPKVFVKGPDYVGKIEERHAKFCREHGIEIRFTEGYKYSSTALINELRGG
jgi:D-beta-D-heptose 7-phosphate kinase/D-beta-D-heptose 1-phosphate adenosyltransferase